MTEKDAAAAPTLRSRAEAKLGATSRLAHDALGYELSVQRVELELQNEELLRTVDELEAERERFRLIFERAPVAYLLANREGAIERANAAARDLFGPEIVGGHVSEFVTPDDVDFASSSRDFSERPISLDVELTFRERTIDARLSSTPTTDGFQIAITDISSETELRKQHDYCVRLHDIARVIILSLDRRGRIVHYNRFMAELSGVTLDEARGRSWFDLFVPESSAEVARALFQQSIREGAFVSSAPLELATSSGGERMIQWTGSAVRGGDEVTGMLYVGIDVTDLISHERAANLERERSRAILENAHDGIITTDEAGDIETFNSGAERLFGCLPSELRGMNIKEFIPAFDEMVDPASPAGSTGVGAGRELEARRPDGATFPIHLSIAELQVGDRRSYCAFVRDLTESKEAEERLRQAHKLEAVGTLASGVAHDFNNLLMGVAGCADVALSRLVADSEVRPFVEEIRRSARSGAAITKQLLSFTRNAKLETTVFALNNVIDKSQDMLQRLLGEDILIELRLDAADSRVRADLGQIEQVLMNLTVNARDSMEDAVGASKLTIETAMSAVGGRRYVRLRVKDSGVGMSREVRERIFEPFFSTKSPERGTGLGLSVVYGIVSQLGGTIRVDSQVGVGTTIEVDLPHASERITEEFPVSVALTSGTGRERTILVAEDDATVRLALRHYLESAGFRVLEAATGSEAIRYIEAAEPIDLLLTDMVLPGIGGAGVAQRLRAAIPGAQVLHMSAHSTEWLVDRGRLPAGSRVLQKPFSQATLVAEVERVLAMASSGERETGTVLLANSDATERRELAADLREVGFDVFEAGDAQQALKLGRLNSRNVDAVVIDESIPDDVGVAIASELDDLIPGVRVAITTSGCGRSTTDSELTWPRIEKPVSPDDVKALLRSTGPQQRLSILLIEDNPAARMALSELLADTGAEVTTASTGAEALDAVRERGFDLLLVDYILPDLGGSPLVAEMGEDLSGAFVVYMSGDPSIDVGDEPVLEKPIDFAQLRAVVRNVERAKRES